jgi:hypothetical protein
MQYHQPGGHTERARPMITRTIFKNLPKTLTLSSGEELTRQPYIVPAAPTPSPLQRRPAPTPRHSVIHTRAHRGLKLVSTPNPARPARRHLWSGWLAQKHLDRGFLFLAASSALLLLLTSR